MQVRIEDVSPVEKKLIVEVPWETVSVKLGDAYKELGKGVQLRGFRKGKVPRPVLEQMFGARVKAEVAYQLVRESFLSATAEHKLDAVAEPRVDAAPRIEKGRPFTFEAIVEVKGDVVVKDAEGMPLEQRRLAVADDAVDAALEKLRLEHTEYRPIEGRTTLGDKDVVVLSIEGTIGDEPISRPQFTIDLEDRKRDPLPGLIGQVAGLPLDTKDRLIELDIPADHTEKEVAGKKASLKITVVDAREKDTPALDDDFAKDTGKAEDLVGLRVVVRQELEEAQRGEIRREVRDAALKELVKRNPIPVASTLVERATEYQWNRLRQMLGMADQRGGGPQITEELREKIRPSATDEVRGQLLLDAIADKEGIAVNDDEIDAHVGTLARARNTPPARLRAEYDRDGRLDGIRFQLRQEKTLDLLVSRAAVTEVDQLTARPDEDDSAALGGGSGAPEHAAHAHAPGHVHGPDCDHDH